MSAAILAFQPRPARRPARVNDYAAMYDLARRMTVEARIKEAMASATPAKAPEDEILKLLRRIDRRLVKLAAA